MKKHLLLGFLILFVLSTAAFAGFTDPKSGSEKPVVPNPKENKLSDEEISRLSSRFEEINNLNKTNLSNKGNSDLKSNPKATRQDYRRHHGYIFVGGGGILLIVVLILILA
jgi:hypothetical protein